MTVKGEIAKYRERLDKTLASHDLTNGEALKSIVKDQMQRSAEYEIQEFGEHIIEKRTAELSNFLDMLRIPSESNEGDPQKSSHPTWKLKQDTEEIRVMYREGPEGSPYHTLLVEGYVDAPVDACLCISVEVALYQIWFPETKVPTFKIILAQCLRRIRIGENISLVRVKLSWPLSNREGLLHLFEFEYLEDGLVVVMIHTPDVENIQKEIHDFSDDKVPEAGQTVRIDFVGGFALQKVTEERSYFRTIGNMDVKLDFFPPWLINFVSRQLIGTGFKLYKKILTSKSKEDENLAKALNDPLYVRIRKALYPSAERNTTIGHGEALSSPKEEVNQGELVDERIPVNDHVSESSPEYIASSEWKPSSNEIEEEEIQSTEKRSMPPPTYHHSNDNYAAESNFAHKSVRLSPQVQKALGTLDKAISVVREARAKSLPVSPVHFYSKGSPKLEITEAKHLAMEDCDANHLNITAPLTPPKVETMDRTLRDLSNRSKLPSVRLNHPAKEADPSRLAPASPELILSSSNASPQVTPDVTGNGHIGTPNSNINANGVHKDNTTGNKKTGQHKRWRMCCLHLVSGRLVS